MQVEGLSGTVKYGTLLLVESYQTVFPYGCLAVSVSILENTKSVEPSCCLFHVPRLWLAY